MEFAEKPGKRKYSVQLQFVATFSLIILGLLALLNTYPLIVFRDLIFDSKQSSMQSQASVMSSALSPLETLAADNVRQVMELMDVVSLSRVVVTDEAGLILYDTSELNPKTGRYALVSEVSIALRGEKVFFSRFSDNAFVSRTAMPVMNGGVIIGSVYLCEYDVEQGQFITEVQRYLRNISLAVGAFALILIFIFTRTLTRRITDLVRAIRIVRDGDYDYRMSVRGNDELTELGEELNGLTERLQSTEEARRRFVSDASHELRTPLASIRLLSESILQSGAMDNETMREFVSDIGNESERLQRTTEKLLDLTRIDRETEVAREMVDVKKVVENTLHMLSPLAEKNMIELKWDLADGCGIYAAEDDIYQIVFNVVENAIKYNLSGGEVSLALFCEEGEVVLRVDDTGIGIPEEDLPHIFSRFYRVDKARSREAGGSGLGLSIVRDAVILHGGTVKASPLLERGTRFELRFRLHTGGE